MKMLPAAGIAFLFTCTAAVNAQQPRAPKVSVQPAVTTRQTPPPASSSFTTPSLSAPAVTPELWVYSQEQRRHDDPAQAVRRKAEIKADQRISRLATLKWYGQSNSRPEASPIPFMGVYSASWTGNSWSRYDWMPSVGPSLILR